MSYNEVEKLEGQTGNNAYVREEGLGRCREYPYEEKIWIRKFHTDWRDKQGDEFEEWLTRFRSFKKGYWSYEETVEKLYDRN